MYSSFILINWYNADVTIHFAQVSFIDICERKLSLFFLCNYSDHTILFFLYCEHLSTEQLVPTFENSSLNEIFKYNQF